MAAGEAETENPKLKVVESCDPQGIIACYAVMQELRETLDPATYEAWVSEAMTQGYRLARAEETAEGRGQVVGVIGYRLWKDLIFGRSLYVDDLVVTAARRGGGIGAALLRHAENVARAQGCAALRLASGLWREDAHRFYQGFGLVKRGYTFVMPLRE